MTALDSDQSSYKQSEEEESELESDVEDVEFSREPAIFFANPVNFCAIVRERNEPTPVLSECRIFMT